MSKTIFEKSQKGQRAYSLPREGAALAVHQPDAQLIRKQPIQLPEVSELDLMRHFSLLARKSVGIDNLFYPLGSCTMKYNPRVNEQVASLPGFAQCHPLADPSLVQGCLAVTHNLLERLCELCGFSAGSLVPNAGAQGEFVGVRLITAYHASRGDSARTQMLVPDSAHGTNPATAALCGYETLTVRSTPSGGLDLHHLRSLLSPRTAGLMLTNPNTLGVFDPAILEITAAVHEHGGLLYYDGANLNPILHQVRPGDMGFDVMHINLHKTFSTPHGGGGPGSGPVLCNERLAPFLPVPRVTKQQDRFDVQWHAPDSMGSVASFFGNFGIYLRAYVYILQNGRAGLKQVAEQAVLNANYLKKRLEPYFTVPYSQPCMHEFIMQITQEQLAKGVRALDVAKRLLDYGFYAPTIYFPLTVKECLLVEPTETESKATLDAFVNALIAICEEIKSQPETVRSAPHTLPVGRLDDVRAARHPVLKHEEYQA